MAKISTKGQVEYIFSINTGRSGSNYLCRIFENVKDCKALHEPRPICNGMPMRKYLRGKSEPMKRIMEEKTRSIRTLKSDFRLYFESNHCFIKGFGWFIPQYFPQSKLGVIILRRNAAEISDSLLRIGCTPLTARGRMWICTPDAHDSDIDPPRGAFFYQFSRLVKLVMRVLNYLARQVGISHLKEPSWLVSYERACIEWYVEEINAKASAFKRRYPQVKYYEVDIKDLNCFRSVKQMLEHFGCEGTRQLKSVVGSASNLKRNAKSDAVARS